MFGYRFSVTDNEPMLPEVLRLALEQPRSVDQRQVPDVGLLRGDELGEDHQLRLRLEHHGRRVDAGLLPGVQLPKKTSSPPVSILPHLFLPSRNAPRG